MVPFGAFTTQAWDQEPQSLARYGGTRALEISGMAAPSVSSGDAMLLMENMVEKVGGGHGTA